MGRTRWTPILTGELRRRALEAVAGTVASVRRQRGGTPDVAHGLSGLLLLLIEARRARAPLVARRDIDRMLARVVSGTARVPLSPGLFEGYAGVGLTLEVARRAGLGAVSGADVLDRALVASVERFAAQPPELAYLDQISGLAGQGTFAVARLPRARARRALEAIVGWLDRTSLAAPGGRAWLSPPRRNPQPGMLPGSVFDLGLAHGVPGILAFLARALAAGIAVPTTRRLLATGTRWLVRQARPRDGAAFDAYAPGPDQQSDPGWRGTPGRLAWCYGDPGVVVALLRVAHALGDARLRAAAIAMVRRIAAVRDDPTVVDASLCHGTAGLLHILNRLYQATGEASAREAAIHWAERTLAVRSGPRAIVDDGLAVDSPYREQRFLVGATGSALALLGAASPVVPLWDAFMLLDLPTGGPPRRPLARSGT